MKWKTLQHNGIAFPPPFESKGITIRIKGEKVPLSLDAEEMAYQWAKKKDTPYVKDSVFQKNFFSDFITVLPDKYKKIAFSDIDFSDAFKVVDKEKDAKLTITKEEKKKIATTRKEIKEKMKGVYGKAMMDGKEVEVANWMAEPPGLFIGRGDHPIRGRWKPRVTEKDVTLNLGKGAKVPPGKWGQVIHESDFMWLASWEDSLTEKKKYVWLSDTSDLKQERDKMKYEKATKLSEHIDKVLDAIVKKMSDKEDKVRRIATVSYLIYKTAMRVGDEKDPDEADTVGATTLRVEHIKLKPGTIEFDFLGKDSVRWQKPLPVGEQDKVFYENLKMFTEKKKQDDLIFDGITSRHVNEFLSGVVKGLTAKVFRTYLATNVVRNYLKKVDKLDSKSENIKIYHAKMANLEAAITCNHKRTIPKSFEEALQKKRDALKKLKETPTKTEKQAEKQKQREEKLKLTIELTEKTRDYNLGTSLRNYVDPRVVKAWSDQVGLEWEKLYTSALQKKFQWVSKVDTNWKEIAKD
ncbi:DNA topoisomerase I, eukaryotic-type [Candidatus Nitrosotalea sp. TS]|uniref:DNA topoisomerase I n=1 Tax=Candidatus Nitrosotalea sp. TS TaxID=2341020 RepID=UPI001408003F|nr:DNA topoisomerase I [Candidatus Nitrosotalea sp. TS]NHI03473.1 DNA topoisomerase I, eukaryotic-type [Candidatus Nitrosotalea sp. TS]